MSTALTGMVFNARRGRLKVTGQLAAYHSGDDGDRRRGLLSQYDVLTTGQYSLTKNIEVAHYAANGITFGGVGGDEIQDAAAGLVTFLTNDVIVVKGAATPANNAVYTVTTGGVAGHMHVNPAITPEAAGAMVSLYKRTAHNNECVRDLRTGLMWSRNTSSAEKVGEASTGLLIWADVTKVYTIYSSANTISCVPPNIFRITGGAALTQFHVGDLIRCVGFANAVNNTVGFYVTAVTPNAGNLDIVIDPVNSVLVAEGAVGDSIGLVTRSIFNYAAGARLIGLAGYTDWRLANLPEELLSLYNMANANWQPNAAAFPAWPSAQVYGSVTSPNLATTASYVWGAGERFQTNIAKTTAYLAALVRG